MIDYKIPDYIKMQIPEYFYYAFGGEIVSIFGADALIRDENGFSFLEHNSGTCGYVEAFKVTCKKLDLGWLFDYWHTLPWYESDIFDGEIVDEVMKRFERDNHANPYYKYLIGLSE